MSAANNSLIPSSTSPSLPALLPSSSYLIAYAIPLLLASLGLTFAGAFLTLDRTRRFRSRYDALPGTFRATEAKGLKKMFFLEGGLGGLLVGYTIGVHLSTSLALIIPATSSATTSLSSGAFVAVWVLTAISTTILGGRYAIAALSFSGLSGGALFALALCIIVHPGLEIRVVFTIIVMSILLIAVLLSIWVPPLLRLKHPLLRFATSSTGAFGVTLSISLLSLSASTTSWSSPWSHLYLSALDSWDTSTEKGFSALFSVLLLLGLISDWALHKKWGECPDEKWDSYLAEYAANIPNSDDRAGIFRPFESVWDRLFHPGRAAKPNILPHMDLQTDMDLDVKYPLSPKSGFPGKLRQLDSTAPSADFYVEPLPLYRPVPGLLTKKKGHRSPLSSKGFRNKEVVKFRPSDELSSSESDEEKNNTHELNYGKERTRVRILKRRTESHNWSASPNLSDIENISGGPPEYSDFEDEGEMTITPQEEDIVAVTIAPSIPPSTPKVNSTEAQWAPGFLKRHPQSQSHSPLAPAPVPATPSLLNALDRVEKARREAYSQPLDDARIGIDAIRGPTNGNPGSSGDQNSGDIRGAGIREGGIQEQGRGQRWDEFWREIREVREMKEGKCGKNRDGH
ncbi:hypothetical protein J3R30DRAFT_3311152 [Lentinula aciculospora]|uniref:DUF4203 domain-containing protein n=1 Tax=Lentinula aciculospora TaxID=153920 RepID=A0A9W8ZT35_9AGAR|nr:hypothetical protein J3R30DRAFT_3311152 [Lentinula aciculospora]